MKSFKEQLLEELCDLLVEVVDAIQKPEYKFPKLMVQDQEDYATEEE